VFGHVATILHHGEALELLDRRGLSIFFTVVEWVVLLRNFETNSREEQPGSHSDECSKEHQGTRTLLLKMHSGVGIGHILIKILVNVACCVREIVMEVIGVHHVVVDEGTSVLVLGLEVEANIIPVHRPHLVIRVLRVREVLWQGQRQSSGVVHGHLALEVLVFAGVVISVSVLHSDPRGLKHMIRRADRLLQSKCLYKSSLIHFN